MYSDIIKYENWQVHQNTPDTLFYAVNKDYHYQNFASSISARQCNTMNTVMDTINIYSRHFDFSEKYALMSSNM